MKKVILKIWKPIKNILKKIRDFLYRNFITEIIPMKNQILLESIPDFSDNTYNFYLELLKNDYQKKYKIIWITQKEEIAPEFKRDDVFYFNEYRKGIFTKIKLHWLINRSKYIVTCNRFYKRKNRKQVILFLNHGMPLKDCTRLKMNYNDSNISICSSKFFLNELSAIAGIDKEKLVIMQPPRNDGLFDASIDAKRIMGFGNAKVIAWLPTFRKMSTYNRNDSKFDMPLGIPILYSEEELNKLNKYLRKINVILVLKPHPAQDLSVLKAKLYSNFKILYNSDLDKKKITLYQLLGQCDGLITDYSSVYYDFLITKKPIGLTVDDIKEYGEGLGLAYDYFKTIKGHYIYELKDLYKFVDNISNENDEYKNDRMKAIKKFDFDLEGNYSKKVFDYMKKHYKF